MSKIISAPLQSMVLTGLLACGLLSACSHGGGVQGDGKVHRDPMISLAMMNWQLVSIRRGLNRPSSASASGIPAKRYQLDFVDGHMRLRGGCNSVNGTAKIITPGKLQVGPMVMTNRGCNTKLMQADSEIGRTLSHVTHYKLEKGQLAMLGAKRILLFNGIPKPKQAYSNSLGEMGVRKAKFW